MSLSAALTRRRSLTGIDLRDRSAALARRKSQFTLEIFQTDEFPTIELGSPAPDCPRLVSRGVIHRKQPAVLAREDLPQGFTNEPRAAPSLLLRRLVDCRQHLFGDRY